jgi:hypothetical protein
VKWQVVQTGLLPGEASRVHVIPKDDLRPHDCAEKCWCEPEEDHETLGLFLHNSMDGREAFEAGKRLTS